ncbi:MAG TPA: hypothetical protein VGB42_04440 [Candidatus Thermoplasmatota archaeon]
MPTYAAAAALLFGAREFTAREFAIRTGNPRAAKLLSELKHRGLVARTGRGRYRCLGPDERPDLRAAEWGRAREVLLGSGLPMAWDGASAVEAWTRGGYVTSPSVFTREFHLVVPKGRLKAWEAYLRRNGLSTAPRKRIGVRVYLRPVPRMPKVERVGGEPVISREETLRIARASPGRFAGAEESFDDGGG